MALFIPTLLPSASALPQVTFNDISSLREYETGCDDHWIFDKGGASNLVGLKGAITLAQIGATAPTYNSKSLTLPSTVGNGLKTNIADSLTRTMCAVVKVPAIDGTTIGKPLFSTMGAAMTSGAYMSIQGGSYYDMWSRLGYGGGVVQHTQNFADLTANTYQFYAFGIDHSGSNRAVRLSTGTNTYDFTSANQMVAQATNELALGSYSEAGDTSAFALEVYELIIFSSSLLTAAQISAVYARSKVRMLRHAGIALN